MRHRYLLSLLTSAALALSPGRLLAQGSYEQLQTFSSLLNQIRQSYVDSVSYAELVHAAIDGVLGSLDPHSRFLRRADGDRETAYEAGELAGTGIVFDEVDGRLTVLTVVPRSPAARSGVAPGDRLVSINDTISAGLSQYEVGLRLLGDKGTKVRLLFERGSRLEPDSVRVSLKYDYLEPRSVTSTRMVDATTGYVRLSGFHAKAGEEVERAIKDLKGKGARRLVLDLRGNPGGLVFAAVDVASLFLPKQTLVFKAEGRRASVNNEFRTDGNGEFRDLPLMVLIDDGSASASEALAGTLQDHDRALLLGRRSFGKALMQQGYPIPPQGDLVYLTVGRISTPSGRVIQRAYHGLKASQYYSFAGRSGAAQDTTAIFHTDNQREVRGGGGIVPDIAIPRAATVPTWWGIAADSGWIEAVADSAAALLPKDEKAAAGWLDAPDRWQSGLVQPLLSRVHDRLHVAAQPDSAQQGRLGRILAYRSAEVRWGPDAAEALLVGHDPDLRVAMGYWDQLSRLLGGK